MKNILFKLICISVIISGGSSCSDDDDPETKVIPTMSLTVSDIENNTALITAEQLTGTVVSAKVIDFYPANDISFNYNTEVRLVKFVEENGIPANLPYTKKIEGGLRPGVDYISAIIAYNKEGRAVCYAFQIWKASGTEGMWSDDNSAGGLDENEW